MYHTSVLYKNLAHKDGRDWNAKARVVLKDGTELQLNDKDFMVGGIEWNAATSEQGTFTVGAAVIGEVVLTLNNFEDKFSQYDFTGSVIYPEVGLTTQVHWRDGKIIEWIPLGVYTVDEAPTIGSTIQITALGNLSKLDSPYSASQLEYPATLAQIALDVCNRHGLTLATTTFLNSDYVVSTKPEDNSITDREIMSYIAELSGCFCRETRAGEIAFAWYDFDRFLTPLPDGKEPPAEIRKSSEYNIETSDITVTGVQIIPRESDGNQYIYGTEGYVVKIEYNPLAQENLQELVSSVGEKLVGMTFTPYTVTTLSDPSLDCGDVVLVTDKKGIIHQSFISNADFAIDGYEIFSADAESQSKNQSVRFSGAEKAQESADKANQGVAEAKASIDVLNGEIVLKVSKDSVIQAINLSSEGIKIDATKLDIHAYVTFTDLASDGATTISGGNIKTDRIESQGGEWWLDLETGKVYLSDGTFKGTIVFGTDGYLKQDSTTGKIIFTGGTYGSGIEIDGGNGGIRLKTGGTTGGVTECDDLECRSLSIDGNHIPSNGYTGNVGIQRSDGSTRTLHFTHGILDDNDA
ncbi:hypothetical protein ACRQV7_03040 [Caproiciproducens sp. R2]|uniref:hypothetical protein n=1 Tax=Caproiciproducens sp. R2 TaxID=3435187 RepID=UPI0040342EF5